MNRHVTTALSVAMVIVVGALAVFSSILLIRDRHRIVERREELCAAIDNLREGWIDAFDAAGVDLTSPEVQAGITVLRERGRCDPKQLGSRQ